MREKKRRENIIYTHGGSTCFILICTIVFYQLYSRLGNRSTPFNPLETSGFRTQAHKSRLLYIRSDIGLVCPSVAKIFMYLPI